MAVQPGGSGSGHLRRWPTEGYGNLRRHWFKFIFNILTISLFLVLESCLVVTFCLDVSINRGKDSKKLSLDFLVNIHFVLINNTNSQELISFYSVNISQI